MEITKLKCIWLNARLYKPNLILKLFPAECNSKGILSHIVDTLYLLNLEQNVAYALKED